jgi:hypothetical protein
MSDGNNNNRKGGKNEETTSFDGGGGDEIIRDKRSYSLDDVDLVAELEDDSNSTDPTYTATSPGSPNKQHRSSSYHEGRSRTESEEDDEIRLAKELALAIAQNPNMTPDELKTLQEKSRKKVSAAKTVKRAVRSSIKVGYKGVAKSASKVKGAVSSAASAVSGVGGGGGHAGPSTPGSSSGGVDGTPRSNSTPSESPFARNRKTSGDSSSSMTASAAAAAAASNDGFSALTGTMFNNTDSNGQNIRMTGIVWKRRSGLGKYSSHAAWERRRVILQGTQLLYYKTVLDSKDDEASHTEGNDDGIQGNASDDELVMPTTGGGGGPMSFLPSFRHSSATTTNDAARGYIDLLKEQACISASYGHSGAPTPFALSIKVLSQTKWKLCFDTHQELVSFVRPGIILNVE